MEQRELLSQCAESKVYACNFFGKEAVIKHRFVKEYRHPVLDQKLREQRTVREARALVRCRKLSVPAPVVYSVDRVSCTIIMERIQGISARDLINGCADGITREVVGKRVLESIGEIVGLLHQGDVIHGDLTTSNFIVVADTLDASSSSLDQMPTPSLAPSRMSSDLSRSSTGGGGTAPAAADVSAKPNNAVVVSPTQPLPPTRNGLVVIDFGLVLDKNSAEERAVDLYVLERAVMSAHPLLEDVSTHIEAGYLRCIAPAKGKQTMDRLMAVRARGRKRSMIG